ncbi:MAG: transposase [Prevotellaceae bacterium]|nr:transposase [Prevotellaceae bacterium]
MGLWEMYKRRNEIERLFGRIKRFRRIFTRYEKTDIMYIAFIMCALIIDCANSVNTS